MKGGEGKGQTNRQTSEIFRVGFQIIGAKPVSRNKGNVAIKRVTHIFWFASAYKSYVYAIP